MLPPVIRTVRALVLAAAGGALLCLAGCGAVALGAGNDADHLASVERWRSDRLAQMTATDGWLSYTASGRLRPGRHVVGGSADSDVRLPLQAGRLGMLEISPDSARFLAADGSAPQPLVPGRAGEAPGTRLALGDGQFYLVRHGPQWGWRFRQPAAVARHPFKGFEYYPVQAQWRIQARWKPYPVPRPVTVMTSIGTALSLQVPGEASFELDGRTQILRPVHMPAGDDRLMFIFTDRSSGRESYGGGRYLIVAPPRNGRIELDFNRAENPACAVSAHVACPVAPADSRLDVAVLAGEKTWYPR